MLKCHCGDLNLCLRMDERLKHRGTYLFSKMSVYVWTRPQKGKAMKPECFSGQRSMLANFLQNVNTCRGPLSIFTTINFKNGHRDHFSHWNKNRKIFYSAIALNGINSKNMSFNTQVKIELWRYTESLWFEEVAILY